MTEAPFSVHGTDSGSNGEALEPEVGDLVRVRANLAHY